MNDQERLKKVIDNLTETIDIWKKAFITARLDHKDSNAKAWNIMGRATVNDDNSTVTVDISDWRELCEAVNFGV